MIEDIDVKELELHRPYVDDIHLKCPKCNKTMKRVTDVLDVWFDSGAMPYAQFHYPFENKELFDSQFPGDFIAEGVDQTRGWFNSLLCISSLVSGVSSYKNVVVNDMMLDANGKKMSKSVGNIINPIDIMTEYGADLVRYYMLYASPVWTPLRFDVNGLKEVHSKFFNPLKNTYNFFTMYANTDSININECFVDISSREEIDKWLLSRYNKLVKNVTTYFEEYDLHKVVKELTEFVSEDLSNWYIRRNRNRFWKNEFDTSKKSVYITTYEVLIGLCQLMAPIVPFLSEEMYRNLTNEKSVHLSNYPVFDQNAINEELEEKMSLVRSLISMGRQAREETKIKVRQPIQEVIIDGKNYDKLSDLVDLIKEELNVKEVVFEKDLSKYMNFTIKPNFKTAGPILGAHIKDLVTVLNSYTQEEIKELQNNEEHFFEVDDQQYNITLDMVDIRIVAKDGFDVAMENNNFIILNTNLSKELIEEGISREFVSKIQNLRKLKEYDIADRIDLKFNCNEELKTAFLNNQEYIKSEILAKGFEFSNDKLKETVDINNDQVTIDIMKNNE